MAIHNVNHGDAIMNTVPVTDNCLKNLKQKEHVCFGISPFNSYFSEAKIQELAAWGKAEFKSMHFFIPDVPAAFTLEAIGYDAEAAAWKAKRQAQYLHNKLHRALKNLAISDTHACEMVLNWEILKDNKRFLSLYQEATQLFFEDMDFQKACLEASRWVLEKRVPETENLSLDTLCSAARYLLAEIPLFLDTAGITGQSASVFCYHQCVSLIEKLMRGHFKIRSSSRQGFVILDSNLIASAGRKAKEDLSYSIDSPVRE